MLGRVILDVILCTLATLALVGIVVAGHVALARRSVRR